MNVNKKYIIFGSLIYLLLVPFFYHPDIKSIYYLSQFFSAGQFNIYSFLGTNPDLLILGPFVYPPLAYLMFGLAYIPISLVGGSAFVNWLPQGSDAVAVEGIFGFLYLIKLPQVLVHIATSIVLYRKFGIKKKYLLLWFFNPISIYTVAVMGQFDGIPALLSLIALSLAGPNLLIASLLLGLAAGLKTYALLLVPFFAFVGGKRIIDKVGVLAIGFGTYILITLPFITTPEFYSDTLVSGLSTRIFDLRLGLGFGESILVIPLIYFLLLIVAMKKSAGKPEHLVYYMFSSLAIVIAGIHFHPQWAMWFLPFLIIIAVKNKLDYSLALLFIGWLGTIILFNDKFLTWGIISVLDPGVLFLPTPADVVNRFYDSNLLQSAFHTLFASAVIFISWIGLSKALND